MQFRDFMACMVNVVRSWFCLPQYLIVFPKIFDIIEMIERKNIRGCQLIDYFAHYQTGVATLADVIDRFVMFKFLVADCHFLYL